NIGPAELIVILLVALLIVGPKRLPEVGKSVGKALREIRRQTDEVRSSFEMNLDADDDDHGEPVEDVTGTPAQQAGDDGWDASEWGGEDDDEPAALPEGTPTTPAADAGADADAGSEASTPAGDDAQPAGQADAAAAKAGAQQATRRRRWRSGGS